MDLYITSFLTFSQYHNQSFPKISCLNGIIDKKESQRDQVYLIFTEKLQLLFPVANCLIDNSHLILYYQKIV